MLHGLPWKLSRLKNNISEASRREGGHFGVVGHSGVSHAGRLLMMRSTDTAVDEDDDGVRYRSSLAKVSVSAAAA